MQALTDITRYDESLESYSKDKLWALFDGDREQINIAHECVDRHPGARIAINIIDGEGPGHDESISFAELKD